MKVTLVYNHNAGSRMGLTEIRKLCKTHGVDIENAITFDPGFARRLKPAIDAGGTIAVIGGDGTISAVAGLVAHTKAALAPLPGGTLNHFTKDLGIPQDLNEALKRLPHAKVHKIDAASVNDRIFINNSSIGLYPSSLQERDRLEEKLGKWPAAVIASFQVLLRLKAHHLKINGKALRTPFIFIGNNNYDVDSVGIAVRKRLDQKQLSIFIARTVTRLTLLKIALLSLIGRSSRLREFDIRTISSDVTITSRHSRLDVSHDGEVSKMKTPLHYRLHPGALKVLY